MELPVVKVTKDGQLLKPSVGLCPIRVTYSDNGKLAVTVTEPGDYRLERADGKHTTLSVPEVLAPINLAGPWRLRFPSAFDAALKQLDLLQLSSWSDSSDDVIRYFSGTATYEIQINLPPKIFVAGRRLMLDLGRVEVIAEVRVNGKDIGTLWKQPFAVDITDAVTPGSNTIEIMVTNTWWNRLAGDESLPDDKRTTFTVWKPKSSRTPLMPSGLLGPVNIQSSMNQDIQLGTHPSI